MATEEQFNRFVKLQKSGVINMNDSIRGSKLARIPIEIYENIMFNYSMYKDKYKTT